jgi:hypothetical protein
MLANEFITEVERIRRYSNYLHPEHIKDYVMDKPKRLFNFKSYSGEQITVYQTGENYVSFIATDSKNIVQMSVVGEFNKIKNNKSAFWVEELVSAKNRKLRASELYTQLLLHLNLILVSDKTLSDQGAAVWERLSRDPRIQTFMVNRYTTGKIWNVPSNRKAEFFAKGSRSWSYGAVAKNNLKEAGIKGTFRKAKKKITRAFTPNIKGNIERRADTMFNKAMNDTSPQNPNATNSWAEFKKAGRTMKNAQRLRKVAAGTPPFAKQPEKPKKFPELLSPGESRTVIVRVASRKKPMSVTLERNTDGNRHCWFTFKDAYGREAGEEFDCYDYPNLQKLLDKKILPEIHHADTGQLSWYKDGKSYIPSTDQLDWEENNPDGEY